LLLRIISLFLLASFLFAEVKIYATKAKEINKIVYLENPVIIYNNEILIQAKRAKIIDKKIFLKKDVVVFYKETSYLADSAEIINKNKVNINTVFLVDNSNEIWIKAKKAKLKNENLILKDIIFSSCCIENPDWYLRSSRGAYNKKTKYIKLYHIRLYIHDVPVFYFPFYFNSLDKTRRSGLLRPYVGYSAKEGFLYSQPIYIVLGQRADLELTPTIRTFRGKGLYSTFRFVSSPYDYGEIKFGEFIDFKKYNKKHNLANKTHYGYQLFYKRDEIFKNDKLYMNIKYANDVDYFYLNPYNYTFDTKYLVDKLITSKLNYINEFSDNYIAGIYAKYFIDTTKVSNDDTLQILPQLNLHKYEQKDFILNSFDLNLFNYYSKSLKYYQATLNIPLAYNFKMFDDYLNIKISENFDYVTANRYNSKTQPQAFYQLYSTIKFYNSLTKKRDYIHILNPAITFNFAQKSKLSKENDLLSFSKINDSITFSLFQIFEKKDFYFDHDIKQNFENNFKNPSPMENIFNLKKAGVSATDTNKYDWDLQRFIYNSISVSFPVRSFYFKISHIYNYPKNGTLSQSYTLRTEKKFNKFKKGYFEYNYDIENKYYKYFLFGIKLNKKCWQYDFSLQKERIPVMKDEGISYTNNYMLRFNINFYPIGGLKQTIQLK